MLIKLEWLGYRRVKKLWQYVKPFSSNTGTWRTDRRSDRIAISISRVSMLTRDKNAFLTLYTIFWHYISFIFFLFSCFVLPLLNDGKKRLLSISLIAYRFMTICHKILQRRLHCILLETLIDHPHIVAPLSSNATLVTLLQFMYTRML